MQDPTAVSTRCTIQKRNGSFCDAPGAPDAPYPICAHHVEQVGQFANALRRADYERVQRYLRERQAGRQPYKPPRGCGVVYYLYVDGLIKIGHSVNIRDRLTSYPPNAHLLVTELGSLDDERARHRQFAEHLKARKEWFAPAAELWEHIRRLRGGLQDGEPWLDVECKQVQQ